MIALVAAVALAAALALFIVIDAKRDRDRARGQLAVERAEHRLERSSWGAERVALLNRIQDPAAGVVASLSTLELPEPGHLDVDFER